MLKTRSRYDSACILMALILLVPLFSVNVAAASVPDPPTNLTADGGNAKITLNWTAPVNDGGAVIDGYLVYKGSTPLTMSFYRNVLPTPPLTFVDTTVVNGLTYYYNIVAHNELGQSTYSSTVSAMPLNVPSAPTATTATPAIGQMSLSWNPPYNEGGSPVTNYRIYRGTTASLLLFLKDSAQTSMMDTGLSNGQTYYYQITAVNAVGEGVKCAVFSGTLASPPGPLLDLQAVSSDSKVTLTWTAPSDNGGSPITGYTVHRSVVSGHETVLSPVTGTTYQDLNLVNGVTYYYRVSAVNAVGEGQMSDEVTSTPSAVLAPPTSITATPSDSSISLSWTAPANTGGSSVSSYKVYRGTTVTTLLFLVSVTQTSYQDTGLTNGQAYFYKISSVNSVGEGLKSGAASATPFSIPSVPLSLNAIGGNGGVSLGWAAPFSNGGSSILRYHIYWSESATGPWTKIDTLSAGLVYAHTGLTNGHTYYYQAAAVNAAGEGPRTLTASATPRTVPSAPVFDSATGGVGSVTLAWAAPLADGGSALTKYSVYRGTSSGSETFLRDAGPTTTMVDSSVLAGMTYFYHVTAWNSQGESLRSNEASATTFGLPTAPTSLTGTAGDQQISLQWGAPSSDGGSALVAYRMFYGTGSGNYSGNQTVSSSTFLQLSLTNGVRYYYAVSAINSVGEGPLSSEYSAVPMTNPSAPQSLLAIGGVRQVSLSWMPPLIDGGSNITGYKLYRGPSATGQSLIATLGPALEFTDTGLSNGTTYHYSVTAINSRGESLHSLDASARTNAVPSVPFGLSVAPADSQASLAWSPPTDNGGSSVTSYNVYRSITLGSYALLGNTASLSYSDPGLSNGQRYYYSVAAVNAVGEGTRTTQIPVVPATSPSEPTQLVAVPGVKKVALSWTTPSSDGGSLILGYHILRGNAPGSETHYTDVGTGSFTDSSLDDGETHYYKVAAYNALSEGPASNEASATTFSLPSRPAFLQATSSDRAISLRWSEPVTNGGTSIQYYTVYRGNSPESMSMLTSISSLSFDDTGLTNGQTYYYAVSATNAVGEGQSTAPMSAIPSRTPSAPMQLSSEGGIRQVGLNWSPPLDLGGASISSYRLYRSSASNGSYELIVSIGSTSYTDTNLDNSAKYFYRVTAINPAGEGPYAETNSTTLPLPESPALQAEGSGLDVHLTWTESPGAATFRIYRGDASGQETYLRSVIANSFVDGPFASGRTVYYKVTAVDATGESLPSNEVSATIVTAPSAPTGLSAASAGAKTVLNWQAPLNDGGAPVQIYQVLRGLTPGAEVLIGTSDSTVYNDTLVESGIRYYYQVRAINSAGTGPASNEANVLFSNTFTAPHLIAMPGLNKVDLRWTAPSEANGNPLTGYRVYRGTASSGESFLIDVNVTEMADTGVTVGKCYYYLVTGITMTAEGPASNEANATPFTYPGVPASFEASSGDASATMNWTAPISDGYSPVLGYHVFRGLESGNLSRVATVSGLGYHDTGLASGTTYYYRVSAYNAAGSGNATAEVAVSTPAKVDSPIGLTATAGEGKITLMWNQPIGVSVFTYSIFRGNSSGEEEFLVNFPATGWVDNNVTVGQTYYYKVSAMTLQGESQLSEEATATPFAAQDQPVQTGGLFDQMWFRIIIIMAILVVGFFAFVFFVRKGAVQVKRDK